MRFKHLLLFVPVLGVALFFATLAFAQAAAAPVGPDLVTAVLAAAHSHQWALLAALVIYALVALVKQGYAGPALQRLVPPRYVPLIAPSLGFLAVTTGEIIAGKSLVMSVWDGLSAGGAGGVLSVYVHEFVVEMARGGKEVVPQTTTPIPPSVVGAGLALWLVAMVVACGASSSTPANAPSSSTNTRAEYRAAVLAGSAAYNVAANGCVALAKAKADDTIRQGCAAVLEPARTALLVASAAIDAWDDTSSPALVACRLEAALGGIVSVAHLGVTLTAEVDDALVLGAGLVGSCSVLDAGAGG